MYSKFNIFWELFIEFFIVFYIFLKLSKHLKAFFDNIFLYNFQNFVLL